MIVNDMVNEMREQFTANLLLSTSDTNVIINPNITTIFIVDDDRKLLNDKQYARIPCWLDSSHAWEDI